MKYLALLRGINVGGNSIIKMAELKKTIEKIGFKNVLTYIQSGNIIFESDDKSVLMITKKIEQALLKNFNYKISIVIKTNLQLKKILLGVPDSWKGPNDLRCYVAFIKEPITPKGAMKEVELNEGVDFVKMGPGVLYMSTKLSGLTKSRFSRLISKKIYKDITIRNYNTAQKIFELMGKNK